MDAVQLLVAEHRVIERVLDSLEALGELVASGGGVEPGSLQGYVRFLRDYADAIHHGKEEDILFAVLRRQGCAGFEPVLQAVERDHGMGRNLVDDLRTAAGRPAWTAEQRNRVARAATSFVSMLRHHIVNEDSYVFPKAVELLSEDAMKGVSAAFERFEAARNAQKRELEQLASNLADPVAQRPGHDS
jgi:hemerythrin-like domain-containing protein